MKSFNRYLEIIQEANNQKQPVFYEITDTDKDKMLSKILNYIKITPKFKFEVDFDKQDIVIEYLLKEKIEYDILTKTLKGKKTAIFSPGQAIRKKSKDDNFELPYNKNIKGSNVGRGLVIGDMGGSQEVRKMNPMNVKPPFQGIG